MNQLSDIGLRQNQEINLTIIVVLSENDGSQEFSFEFLVDQDIIFNEFFDQFKQDILSERLSKASDNFICKLQSGRQIEVNETKSLRQLGIDRDTLLYIEVKSSLCKVNQLTSAFQLEVTVEYSISEENLQRINQYIESIKRNILTTGYQKVQNLQVSIQMKDE